MRFREVPDEVEPAWTVRGLAASADFVARPDADDGIGPIGATEPAAADGYDWELIEALQQFEGQHPR